MTIRTTVRSSLLAYQVLGDDLKLTISTSPHLSISIPDTGLFQVPCPADTLWFRIISQIRPLQRMLHNHI